MNIIALSKEEFNNKKVIYLNNILEGFDNYEYIQLSPQTKIYEDVKKSYIGFLENIFNINGNKVVIDFYKSKLDENGLNYIYKEISEEDKNLFDKLMNSGDKESIFFEIRDPSYIPLLIKLNLRELFFTSFYFEKAGCTLWGNYNYTFPIFFNNKEIKDKYKKIAEQYSLL